MLSGVLLDIAGVVHDGDQAVPGVVGAVEPLRENERPVRFLTNSTRQPKRS